MLRARLFWKLYAGCAALLLLTLAGASWLVGQRLERQLIAEVEQQLHAHAAALREVAREALRTAEVATLGQQVRGLSVALGVRLTVLRDDGSVLADSAGRPAPAELHLERPEIEQARRHGLGKAVRHSHLLGLRMRYVALAIVDDGRLLGYARAALPETQVTAKQAAFRRRLAGAAALAGLGGLALALLLVRRLTRPLTALASTAEAMAAGTYDRAVRVRAQDEVGTLGRAFNRMAQDLRERLTTLTREHTQLLAILDSMVEGVIAVDAEERIVHLNDAAGVILRLSPAEALGKPVWEVTRVRPVVEAITATLRHGGKTRREARVMGQGGEQVLSIHAAPWGNGQGNVAGAVVVLHDVTDLRRLETVRRDFVANVSHELKTPVTAIKGFVETLRDSALDDRAQAERFLDIIARHAERLHTIIEDLLTLARLEQSPEDAALPRDAHLVAEVLQAAVQDCAAKAVARQIRIEVRCDPALRAPLNAPLLEQALVNLLDNAMNASKDGSTVWLEAEPEGGDLVIRVRDQGIGIAPQHLPRIFERFYRVDKARSREHGGTGLGLAIVKHIALAHGGRVSVTSAVGQGSTFCLHLPLAAAPQASAASVAT
ncbi:MAG: PAS domain-containing sensor histidine kinase [Candidatus Tectimicrobiota bacterium]|nr:MAG: PAS domain-containing sensor histidine kinase [Candidatus Tectomicrobia bacterium]